MLRCVKDLQKKKWFASVLLLYIKCGVEYVTMKRNSIHQGTYSSKQAYDVNFRMIYAMRSIGRSYSAIEKFAELMNLPKPMTSNSYDKSVQTLLKATTEVAEETMQDAADEIKGDSDNDVVGVEISGDGSWQRRGYSSLNGTFTALSLENCKVLDCEIMSRHCKSCKSKEPLKKSNKAAYDKWYESHLPNCNTNHKGSAGAMEINGAKRIFSCSIKNC